MPLVDPVTMATLSFKLNMKTSQKWGQGRFFFSQKINTSENRFGSRLATASGRPGVLHSEPDKHMGRWILDLSIEKKSTLTPFKRAISVLAPQTSADRTP